MPKTLEDAAQLAIATVLAGGPRPRTLTLENQIQDALQCLYRALNEPVSLEHHESPEQQILHHVKDAIAILGGKLS